MKIACLGLELSQQEWWKWCKEHEVWDIVFRYKEFGFNSHDVCLTPHILTVYDAGHFMVWSVKTAQSPNGRWMNGGTSGWGTSPVMFCSDLSKGYATEREAIYEALRSMEIAARREVEYYSGDNARDSDGHGAYANTRVTLNRKVLKAVEVLKDRYDPRQLTLF